MIKEDGTNYGNLAGWPGVRIMSLNPRIVEMIRKHCDVGQIEWTKFYMARRFFWKDETTPIVYDDHDTRFFISLPPGKTSKRQEIIEKSINSPGWRKNLSDYRKYRGNPWNSPYYQDSRLRK